MTASNLAPGTEYDRRSGMDDDYQDCPECLGATPDCLYCDGSGVVSETEYRDIKTEERKEDQANE